jgi:hypothetical protein
MEYWAEHPPAHVILAAVYIKPGARGKKKPGSMRDELTSEVTKFGLGGDAGPLPAIYRNKKIRPDDIPRGVVGENAVTPAGASRFS